MSDIDALTNGLLQSLDANSSKKKRSSLDDEFDLPPPPNFDDLIISVSEDSKPEVSNNAEDKHVSSVTVTLNKPVVTPPTVAPKPKKSTVSSSDSKVVVESSDAKQMEPLSNSENKIIVERPDVPNDVSTNAESELDYYTKTLLSNMANPSDDQCYGYCENCKKVVEGEKVGCKAFNNVYHISCFNCETCGKSVHGIEFYAVNSKPYCESCYLASLEKCTVCDKIITERILKAAGKAYHPECFTCVVCKKALDGVPFAVDDDKATYCVDCYHEKFSPKCCVCLKSILPEEGKEESLRIVALERDFHVVCFKCERCNELLSSEGGKGCYPLDGKILCLNCNTISINESI